MSRSARVAAVAAGMQLVGCGKAQAAYGCPAPPPGCIDPTGGAAGMLGSGGTPMAGTPGMSNGGSAGPEAHTPDRDAAADAEPDARMK